MRVGIGYDSHKLVEGRKLILGGVEIPLAKGLLGHSDADVLCHAIMDSLIGALGLGDIGKHFPDNDPQWKDVSSIQLLGQIIELMRFNGYEVSWVDSV
ncbi:MAG: 2-C-methyl-D-erythritol 2,4-cyclodiphosphate synthase, partial [Thermodesulfovibrionales bacterium]|nr:2-C-methyl-D-erythritol 2,4-cyclodiphosphate synthase [Thermodesulfovibrionales bacterium]